MRDSTPEPDVFRLSLELPSMSTFVQMRAPVPNDILTLYAQAAPGQSTKHLFPAYLRLVAQKWEEIVQEGEQQPSPKHPSQCMCTSGECVKMGHADMGIQV